MVSIVYDEINKLKTNGPEQKYIDNCIKNKIKELEAVTGMKTREQEELYGAINARVRTLTGYFDNLETKIKDAFKKEPGESPELGV